MENKIIIKEYSGNTIEFKMIEGHVYANANQMANGFGGTQKLKDWKRSSNTQRYIEALEKVMGKNSTSQLILSKKGNTKEFEQGTWIHEKLVLNFARYLNVEFELWCDEQIATLLREGTVTIDKKQNLLLSIIQSSTEVERAVALNKYELEYVKPLEVNLEKTTKTLEHKQEVINTLVDEVKLKTQRQFLNEIIRMKGVEYIKNRWSLLYRSYEQNKRVNLSARITGYNLVNKPKIKNKLQYIDEVLNDIPLLYSIAVKLFESDFKNRLKKYYDAL